MEHSQALINILHFSILIQFLLGKEVTYMAIAIPCCAINRAISNSNPKISVEKLTGYSTLCHKFPKTQDNSQLFW